MSKLYKLSELPMTTLVEGAKSRLVIGYKAMISFLEMEPNMVFPLHKHASEQIMIVLEGAIKQTIGDEELVLRKGDVLVMESNIIHGGSVLQEGCKVIDVFVPPRTDYLKLVNTQ